MINRFSQFSLVMGVSASATKSPASGGVHEAHGLTRDELSSIADAHDLPAPPEIGPHTGTLTASWIDQEDGGRCRHVTLSYTRTQSAPERFSVRVVETSMTLPG